MSPSKVSYLIIGAIPMLAAKEIHMYMQGGFIQMNEGHTCENSHTLCPICGEEIVLLPEKTKDGRLIGSCGDAFWPAQWNACETCGEEMGA